MGRKKEMKNKKTEGGVGGIRENGEGGNSKERRDRDRG